MINPTLDSGKTIKKKRTRIETPFKTGIPAKVYWILYTSPMIPYQIAKKIYAQKRPPKERIYPILHMLEERGFVEKQNDGKYDIVPVKIIEHFEGILKDQKIEMDSLSKSILTKLVSSKILRVYFGSLFPVEDLRKIDHSKFSFAFNLTAYLALWATVFLQNLKDHPEVITLSKGVKIMNKNIQNTGSKIPLVDKEKYFDIMFKKYNDTLANPSKNQDLLKSIMKAHNKKSIEPSEILYHMWILTFTMIPNDTLRIMTKLNWKSSESYKSVTLHGLLFKLPKEVAVEKLFDMVDNYLISSQNN